MEFQRPLEVGFKIVIINAISLECSKMFEKNIFPNEHNALYHLPGIISFRKFNVLGLATLVLPVYSYFRCCPLYNVIDFIISVDCRNVFVCRLKGTYC